MTDETKETTADEQVDAETAVDETTEVVEESKDEEKADDSSSINYEEELQKERDAREKAEKALAEQSFKERKEKRDDKEEEKEDDKSEDLVSMELRIEQKLRKDFQGERIKEYAAEFTDNDTESQLVVEIHKNRTFPSHLTLREQIEESWLIANKKRVLGENSELKRALASKDGTRKGYSTTHREEQPTAPKITTDMAPALKNAGYANEKGKWIKKLPNGQTLVYDTKLKRGVLTS